jgi:sugar/nucleoside kinase (ribokinase family)
MSEVVCLGILVADVWGKPVNEWPEWGRLSLVEELGMGVGGCAANSGISLTKLGVETSVMGKVGDDGFGRFVREQLQAEGVEVSGIAVDARKGTSATMIMIDDAGERSFIHCIGANATVRPEELDMELIAGARIFDFAGALVMPGFDGEPAASVLKAAQEAGVTTCMDTVWDATGRWMELLEPCLPYADMFLPSLAEAVEITGEQEPERVAEVLLEAGVKTVGLKMGEEGCYIRTAEEELRLPAYEVAVVDGTGSGDAFVAGFVRGTLAGWDLEHVGRFANAVGALCVTGLGTTAGVRDFGETIEFLAEREGDEWRELAAQA